MRAEFERNDDLTPEEFEAAVVRDYPQAAHTLGESYHSEEDDDGPCFCDECLAAAW
jgi:hypothetical protein